MNSENQTIYTLRNTNKAKWITTAGIFMALNIAMSSFGIPVPGGHLYLCDLVICTAALLLDPVAAFAVRHHCAFVSHIDAVSLYAPGHSSDCSPSRVSGAPSCTSGAVLSAADCAASEIVSGLFSGEKHADAQDGDRDDRDFHDHSLS